MPYNASGSQNGVQGYYDGNGVFHPNSTTPSSGSVLGAGIPGFQLTTMGVGTNAPSPNDIWVTQNGVDRNAVTGATRPANATKVIANVPVNVPSNNNNNGGGSLTADILRSKFGFNDQNVINGILNDPSKRAQYEREMGGNNNNNNSSPTPAPAPKKSFADVLTGNNVSFKAPEAVPSAGLNQNLSVQDNPQFLNFSELWKNINNPHEGDWNKIASDKKSMDFGITEFFKPKIAYAADNNPATAPQANGEGIFQSPDNKQSMASNFAPSSEPYGIASMPNGDTRMSDGTIKKGNNYADLITKPTNFDYKPGNAEKTATDLLSGANKGEIYGVFDPNIDDQIKKQAEELYNQGKSEKEVVDFIKKAQEDALNAEYDRLNSKADQLIPQYQKFADQAIGNVNSGLGEVVDLGKTKTDEANNTYAEKLLASQQNKRADETRLRNLFSNLGTAESSAFIENMSKNTSDYGKYEGDLNIANVKSVGDIDKEVVKAKTNAVKQIDSITADKDAKILAVEENKRLYPQEQYVEKQKIMAQYKADMLGIYSKMDTDKQALQNLKLQFMMGQANINQNASISSDLLNQEYALQQKTTKDISKLVPPELDQELTNFSFRPQSSPQTTALWNSLKLKYPDQASLIDQVFMGTDYNTIKSSLTA